MGVSRKVNLTTEELVEELKRRGKTSDEILEFLYSKEEGDTVILDSDKKTKESRIKEIVTKVLQEMGVPVHLKGHSYLRKAIISVVENPDYVGAMTTVLNPEIAKEFNSTSSRVERAIRHAIEVSWERGDRSIWKQYFGNLKKKPTNSEFVATVADRIKLKYMK